MTTSPQLAELARLAQHATLADREYREAVREAVRTHRVTHVAEAAGVTRQTVYNIMREERKP